MSRILLTGNGAAAWGARLARIDYVPAFPITDTDWMGNRTGPSSDSQGASSSSMTSKAWVPTRLSRSSST